jgi:HlyD family secretion protein
MSKRAKLIWVGVAVVVVGSTVAAAVARRGGDATEVKVVEVERRDLVASVTASGQVQPRTKVDVAADISGRIVRLSIKEGQIVRKGQFLLEIDPEQYLAAVQQAEAGLSSARAQAAQARANYLQAKRDYDRQTTIKSTNPQLVSDAELEALRTSVEVNEALNEAAAHNVAQSTASVRTARSNLTKTRILAPMAGRVTRLAVEEGETAVPGTFNRDAALLLTISDMSVLETKVKVDETDVARIAIGDSAVVQIDAFPDTTFLGRVIEIAHSAVRNAAATSQDQSIDYEVTIQLLNPPSDTRPDFSATAKIVTDTRTQALAIPIIALTVRENEELAGEDTTVTVGRTPVKEVGRRDVEGVFVVGDDNKVSFRPVSVGISGENYFEVVRGLNAGERIVGGTYQAIQQLRDGSQVKEAKRDPRNAKDAKL